MTWLEKIEIDDYVYYEENVDGEIITHKGLVTNIHHGRIVVDDWYKFDRATGQEITKPLRLIEYTEDVQLRMDEEEEKFQLTETVNDFDFSVFTLDELKMVLEIMKGYEEN